MAGVVAGGRVFAQDYQVCCSSLCDGILLRWRRGEEGGGRREEGGRMGEVGVGGGGRRRG